MAASSDTVSFDKLDDSNYTAWLPYMRACLLCKGAWRVVTGNSKEPTDHTTAAWSTWRTTADTAAGEIFCRMESSQHIHLKGIEDDPVAIWAKLETVHMFKAAGTRFNAYDDLMSIRKAPDESLQSITGRV